MKTLPKRRKPFMHRLKSPSVLPGFGLALGFTVFYLTIIVLIPLSSLFFKTATITFSEFINEVTSPRVMHSYRVTFSCALIAAIVNCFFGLIVAWILVRYKFPGKKLVDAIIDLPFALPTAVAGIALTALYTSNGWIGQYIDPTGAKNAYAPFISTLLSVIISTFCYALIVIAIVSLINLILLRTTPLTDTNILAVPYVFPALLIVCTIAAFFYPFYAIRDYFTPQGIKVAFTPFGITIAMIFVGLPFVVRTVQPVLQDMERETEEGAASLGASRWQVFYLVILPHIRPALLTGFALSFARALGEYGSIIFIAGNMPNISEITPLFIIIKLEQYDYTGATSIAIVMLVVSFLMLFVINVLQRWNRGRLVA